MADKKWHNPVRSQMGSTVPSTTAPQAVPALKAPFDKPHSMGNGGIPLKIQETLGPNQKVGTTIMTPGTKAGLASPPASGPVRARERASAPSNKK